jgi:hypothetical protein
MWEAAGHGPEMLPAFILFFFSIMLICSIKDCMFNGINIKVKL